MEEHYKQMVQLMADGISYEQAQKQLKIKYHREKIESLKKTIIEKLMDDDAFITEGDVREALRELISKN